ncbi:MAG: CHAT domain-containing protein [Bacteroidales bacterium]|nr:CHAT domain-containing protein [Bacteroidales bacterium]
MALYVVEEIRKTYLEEESQIILNNYARSVIDLGVTVAFQLYEETGEHHYLDEAFKFCEKGQAIILLSALRGLQARSTSAIPEKISEMESSISRELGMYAGLLYEERQKKIPDENKINLWNDKVFYLRSSLDSLHSRIREEYPDFFSLKYGYEVVTTDYALMSLAPDQAILEYYLTDSLIFTFLLTDGQVHGKIAGRKLILTEKLDSLRNCFTGLTYFNPGEDDFYRLTNLSAGLYSILVRPFENQIQGKRLIIVPDGELGYLSFDLLLRQKPGTYSLTYQGLPWLILDHPISYSSSATVFFEQAKIESKKTTRSLLAFAPTYDYTSHARYAGGQDSILLRLNPITGTKEEVNSIPGSFRTTKFFDEEATESNFKKYAASYGILHLAMHTLVDNHNPLYSKLVFQVPENNSSNDGYLNTYELFNMKLNGQLAVLSACNTGSGKLERGEGIISLARGFFYAGIPSVVMTLWEIEDHSSADLMAMFYENLSNGLSNDRALQQAKVSYLESCNKLKSHPYFWAGYVNIGKIDVISTKHSNTNKNTLFITLVILAIGGLLIIFFNRRVFFRKKWH